MENEKRIFDASIEIIPFPEKDIITTSTGEEEKGIDLPMDPF